MKILDHTQRTVPYVAYVRRPGWSLLDHANVRNGRHRRPRTTPRPRITTMQVVLSLLLLGSAGLCPGQTFHLSAGYSGSDVREAGTEQWTGRGGYQFGADVLIGDRLFVKPGLHFVVRNMGYTLLDANTLTEQDYDYTANVLSVPVLLGANLIDPTQDKLFNAYLMAGPTAFIDLGTDLHNDALQVSTHGTQWYLGGAGGLGYGPVFLEAGYHVAMSNVFKGEGFSTNPKVNYTCIIAGVRLRFPGH